MRKKLGKRDKSDRAPLVRGSELNSGLAFELEVKSTFELLGYQVTHDELLAGSQIDLVATLPGPLFSQVLLVECKDLATPIGIETVRRAYAVRDSVKLRYPYATSVIVSRAGFTKTSKEAARNLNVQLMSLVEMKARLFDPSAVIQGVIDNYELSELYQSYVEMSCQVSERGKGTIYKPVENFIDRFIEDSAKPGLAILGNFGSGKTSLCAHYAYQVVQRWSVIEARKILPILIHMRDLQDLFDLEGAIVATLKRTAGGTITESGVKSWLRGGSSILILDGLDEMASGMSRKEIADNLSALTNFVRASGIKFLITCRTHFFKTFIEEESLGDVVKLYVREWGREELIGYVRKIVPTANESLLETIGTTYNLQELAKTPIFLKMIVDTSSEVKGRVNPAKLYKAYTDRWIEDQAYRSAIPPDDKLTLMQEIASHMDRNGVGSISYKEIPTIVRDFLGVDSYETTQKFDSDVRSCSFLIRDDDDVYRFSHKSFAEFFVATKLSGQIKSRNDDEFGSKPYSKEVCGFIANYFEAEFDIIIKVLIGSTSVNARRNACSVLANLAHHERVERALILALETENMPEVQAAICDALATVGNERCVAALLAYCRMYPTGRDFCFRQLKKVTSHKSVIDFVKSLLGQPDAPSAESIIEVALTRPRDFEADVSAWIAQSPRMSPACLELQLDFAREVEECASALSLKALLTEPITEPELDNVRRDVLKNLVRKFRLAIDNEVTVLARDGAADSRSQFVKRKVYEQAIRKRFDFLVNEDHLSSAMDRCLPETAQKRVRVKRRR